MLKVIIIYLLKPPNFKSHGLIKYTIKFRRIKKNKLEVEVDIETELPRWTVENSQL